MSKQNETEWTNDLLEGIPVVLVMTSRHSPSHHSGWPDRFISHPLWQGWLEMKTETGVLSGKQHVIMRRLRAHDLHGAYVVRRPDRIEDEDGELLAAFDGTTMGLLYALKGLGT